MSPVNSLIIAVFIFGIGAYGVMARRNLLIVLLSTEVMLNAVNLAFVALADAHETPGGAGGGAGHVFALCIIALAAAETAVGLAIVLMFFRNRSTVDTRDMKLMKE